MPRDAELQRTARWRESFLMFWRALPQRVKLPAPGKVTSRETLLDAAMRLAALARPNGWLVGTVNEPFTEEQIATAFGWWPNKTRGVLRWFAEQGWLSVRPTYSRRAADERELVIPPSATVAWPGWPLGKSDGSRSSSTGNAQPEDLSVPQSDLSVPHNDLSVPQSEVDGSRSSSTGNAPPGIPVSRLPGETDAIAETGDGRRRGLWTDTGWTKPDWAAAAKAAPGRSTDDDPTRWRPRPGERKGVGEPDWPDEDLPW